MRFVAVAGCFVLLAACLLPGTAAYAVEGVDGVLFHPERVDAKVKGCQVSKPGSYDIEAGSAIELSYAFPVVLQATPKKVAYEIKGESVKASDLGVRRMEQRRGTVGETRIMFYFKTVKAGESSVTVTIDDQKYAYTFSVR